METSYEILISGLVQGVGFRPFVYRLATGYGLKGEVVNRTGGVTVSVQGDHETLDRFIADLRAQAPPAATIRSLKVRRIKPGNFIDFKINPSADTEETVTEVSPDIAVCDECLADLDSDPGRIDYPFINCTNCGPRFTIIRALPYDRENTTMAPFKMCHRCSDEYHDIYDRRFHAQPVACNSCGPEYTLRSGDQVITGIDEILHFISGRLAAGGGIAVKSTGGYNLMCDALDEDAVSRLRLGKEREMKPFAVMFRDIDAVKEYCFVEKEEENMLLSWRRPILILKQKKGLAPSVSSGLNTIGAMLPHMPFHYMLFRSISTPAVVMTSGNISEEPIITSDRQAEEELLPFIGCLVSYNREIRNRADDSVVRIIGGATSMIRRARGFAPLPVEVRSVAEGIFAAGAEQKNTLCIGKGHQAFMSQYIGDIRNVATYDYFRETYGLFSSLFRFAPSSVVCDMHPDYLSGRFATELAETHSLPLIKIQHHHAHAVSVMAEHGLDGKVIGVIMDGTGYGTDGNIWGSEFMIASACDFERFTHFDYLPLPGGDAAVDEPWRMALSCIMKYFGASYDTGRLKIFRSVDEQRVALVKEMLLHGINSPLTCGAGRYFDAVSALLMICTRASFDSEAPMRLESAISGKPDDFYPFDIGDTVSLGKAFEQIIRDIDRSDVSLIAARFHNTVAQIILEVCRKIRRETGLAKVVMSGGVFQNRYLLEKSLYLLSMDKFRVFANHLVPSNDGGISLGQLLTAAGRRELCV